MNPNQTPTAAAPSYTFERPKFATARQPLRRKIDSEAHARSAAMAAITNALRELKALVHHAHSNALRSDGTVPVEFAERMHSGVLSFCTLLNDTIGDGSPLPEATRSEIGSYVQLEMLPYMLLSQAAERWYTKPRGYAGDYDTIKGLYRNEPRGVGPIGAAIDRCFLDLPAGVAVRNRRNLLREEICRTIEDAGVETARITSLACGPAAEIFDVCETTAHSERIAATLLDIDFQALAYLSDEVTARKLKRTIKMINANLVHVALGRQTLDLPPQDLVYSIGLIDYFDDKFVIGLLDAIHKLLRPGGRVILGNFHPSNPTKALMDHVLDWKLIHRTEDDMNRLYSASRFGKPCTRIRFEQQGINLFAECVK